MAVAITVTRSTKAQEGWRVMGTLVLSGTYPTGGEPVDLKPLPRMFSSKKPDVVDVNGKAGFSYQYDLLNEKLFVYSNTAGGANAPLGEHTAATYAAGVSGDVITFDAIWGRPGF